jgi:hypothetical protein
VINLPLEATELIAKIKDHLDQTMGAKVKFTDSSVMMLVLKYYVNERVSK